MKRLLSLCLSLALLVSLSASVPAFAEQADLSADANSAADSGEAQYEKIFEKDRVIDVEIEIDEDALADMYENAALEEYHSANITVDGITLENVGIRTKGNSSLGSVARSASNRYSFRLKFNKYVKGQKLLGLDDMVLNNMYSDSSYMREYLSYEAMREMGMPAPLAVFVNVYINGELQGTYLGVEVLENSFLKRYFGDNDGNLYKQEQGSTLIYREDSSYASSELKVGDDEEKIGLKNMMKVLNEKGDYESVLDVESCLKLIAANTVLGSYDSYNGSMAHNYYLYEHEGKFYALPWDYNMSFGGFGMGGQGYTVSIDTPVSGVSMENRPLINNLLEVPEYKEQYLSYISGFADYLERLEERMTQLAEILRPLVEADPTKFTTMEAFEANLVYDPEAAAQQSTVGGFGGGMAREGFGEERVPGEGGMMRPEGEQGRGNMGGGFGGGMVRPEVDMQPADAENTRGNMGGGFGGGMMRPEGDMQPADGENTRGNMGGAVMNIVINGQKITLDADTMQKAAAIFAEAEDGALTDEQREALLALGLTDAQIDTFLEMAQNMGGAFPGAENGEERVNNFGRGGMGGASVLTYAITRLASIREQLSGESAADSEALPNGEIRVLLNNKRLTFDVAPIIEESRTLVPVRVIFEALGMEVTYENGVVTAVKDGLTIVLTINSLEAYVNGQKKQLDVPGRIVNSRTLVPLRFIGEATGLVVDYDAATKTVTLNDQ